ncbi:hypothetical protein GNF80_06475 [Clostridium perfringens]|nr:hypothetical protein [Clostridium perfringens]
MKLTIENLEDEKIKVTLNFRGKDYSEIWKEKEYGYETINESITNQMEHDDICCEGTDIEILLCNIDVDSFKEIADDEEVW